jgi:protease-4
MMAAPSLQADGSVKKPGWFRTFAGTLRNSLALLGFFVLFYVGLYIGTFWTSKKGPGEPPRFGRQTIRAAEGEAKGVIIELTISGVISSGDEGAPPFMAGGPDSSLLRQLRQVKREIVGSQKNASKKVKKHADEIVGVLLRVNSPGGGVTASDVIHHAVSEITATGVPVVVLLEDIAASGGYYIAAAGDHIVAHETTLTGSIGVLIMTFDASELMANIGLKDTTITSGKNKAMLSPTRPMSEAHKEIAQALVDEMYERFLKVVIDGRKVKKEDEAKLREIADGRILTAHQAKAANLIDEIGYYEDALAKLAALARDKAKVPDAAPDAAPGGTPRVERYVGKPLLPALMGMEAGETPKLSAPLDSDRLIKAVDRYLTQKAVPQVMYLWRPAPQ